MAIDVLSSGSSASQFESFSFLVDYDTVAQTIGLTCTGTGHATLDVLRTSNQQDLGNLNCDQIGSTTGNMTNGASDSAVTYDGTRHIVLGPGATGVDSTGHALPTNAITAAVVGQFNVPKGQVPSLGISLSWGPNSNVSAAVHAQESSNSLAVNVERCERKFKQQ